MATLAQAKASADETALLSHQRYAAGPLTLSDLRDAERQQTEAELHPSVAEARLTGDFMTIQKAFGVA